MAVPAPRRPLTQPDALVNGIRMREPMAPRALNGRRIGLVRERLALEVRMAIHARLCTVDRPPERLGIDVQGNLLPADGLVQALRAVAHQAVGIVRRSVSRRKPGE